MRVAIHNDEFDDIKKMCCIIIATLCVRTHMRALEMATQYFNDRYPHTLRGKMERFRNSTDLGYASLVLLALSLVS